MPLYMEAKELGFFHRDKINPNAIIYDSLMHRFFKFAHSPVYKPCIKQALKMLERKSLKFKTNSCSDGHTS